MATRSHKIHRRVESATSMARFSIEFDEDEEEAPPTGNKRPRVSGPASQSPTVCRRQCSIRRSQSRVVMDDDEEEDAELIPIEEVESDSQGSEDDEFEEDFEVVDEEDEEDVAVDVGSEDNVDNEPCLSAWYQPEHMTSAVGESSRAVLRINVSQVYNNANGALQAVITDPDVLDCPICLDPLCTPVFQCENGHIACSACCSKVKRKCPSCCMPIGYNRCRAIEKVIESVKVSCKNAPYGCKDTMSYNKKSEHEETCPHATCFCPQPSCPFAGSSKNLYLHFGIQHAASTTRFTYNTTFSLEVEINQKHMFLQEQHESVIFILNHQVEEHGRAFNVDCIGPSSLKNSFVYQLTAHDMETSLSLQSVPVIYTNWFEHAPRKSYLTVPCEFSGHAGLLSLHVCIKKAHPAV